MESESERKKIFFVLWFVYLIKREKFLQTQQRPLKDVKQEEREMKSGEKREEEVHVKEQEKLDDSVEKRSNDAHGVKIKKNANVYGEEVNWRTFLLESDLLREENNSVELLLDAFDYVSIIMS